MRRARLSLLVFALGCEIQSGPTPTRVTPSQSVVDDVNRSAEPEMPVAAAEDAPDLEAEPAKPPRARGMSCPNLAAHVHDLLARTGSERTKAGLPGSEALADQCKSEKIVADRYACFIKAESAAELDACSRGAFTKAVEVKVVREVGPKEDLAALEPPLWTRDGDYLALDARCGLNYRTVYPAGGVFVVCDERVHVGPLVNIDEVEHVRKYLKRLGRRRRAAIQAGLDQLPAAGFALPVHTYAEDGTHTGIEQR